MADETKLLCYTKHDDGVYTNPAYSGLAGRLCDLNAAIHLALVEADGTVTPLRNGTGVLFAQADLREETLNADPAGATKTLADPWLVRRAPEAGGFGVCAILRGRQCPDPGSRGKVALFVSDNLVDFLPAGLLALADADADIDSPRCAWDAQAGAYRLEWREGTVIRQGWCDDPFDNLPDGPSGDCAASAGSVRDVYDVRDADRFSIGTGFDIGDGALAVALGDDVLPGNALAISEDEARVIRGRLDVIRNTAVEIAPVATCVGGPLTAAELPKAVCRYSDGSTHDKAVDWDEAALAAIDWSLPGRHTVPGCVRQRHWPFPFIEDEMISDPCLFEYEGRFFQTQSQMGCVAFRVADTIEGLAQAEPVMVYKAPDGPQTNMWAQEMHLIGGVPTILTTYGPGDWTTVEAVVMQCHGEPTEPGSWSEPQYVVRPDGRRVADDALGWPGRQAADGFGISLDMTYFEDGGRHYMMWSSRRFTADGRAYPACIDIATCDPTRPWQLTSDPVRVVAPKFGWDRCETEVDEGPYLLRHGDDLFVTISGSSTGLADLYCVGLLRAKTGTDLLDPASWQWPDTRC